MDGTSNNSTREWNIFGSRVTRSAVVFFVQIFILYIAIITCFVNLTIGNGKSELWIALLSLSLGSILPSPKVSKSVLKTMPVSVPETFV